MISLRVIKLKKEILLLCPNGSIAKADSKLLRRLLTDFKNPKGFKGDYGIWNSLYSDMDDYPGETLAIVERDRLIVLNSQLFSDIVYETKFITASEYAALHGKGRAIIKRLCSEGRIKGAKKHTTGWLIPQNAPYPKRKPRESISEFSQPVDKETK